MESDAREIAICIDMGMTGSVAQWRDSQSQLGWMPTSYLKIPTCLAYDPKDNEGPPIAWGEECDGLPPGQIKECFKAFMGATSFSNANTVPGGPGSQRELHRWVCDYLGAFCAGVADFIDGQTAPGWRNATVLWSFTVPGSWAMFPVVADFKRLAGDAVSSCFPNAKSFRISTDVTEAAASALYLLAAGSANDKQYNVGSTVISCDIGGATTDVAVSTVSSAGRLITWPQLQTESVGTVTMEKAFWLHARHTFRSAGVQNPDQLALEMVRSWELRTARATFTKHQSEDHVKIRLPTSCNMRKWSPSETPSTIMSTIERGYLCIHKDVFESFFTQLVQHIEGAIDEAINTAAEREKHPSIIGFCGGGCQIPYVIKRLERRYGDTISTTYLATQPEMATVMGSTLIWEQTKLLEFISQTSFGIETDDGIRWRSPEESLVPLKFSRAYLWVVNFNCSKRGNFNTHRIIAATTIPSLPNTYLDALRLSKSKRWTIQVNLQKEKGAIMSWTKKYQVVCNISGPWDIDFRAETLATGQDIPCAVTGEESHK
ncbi:uncharacterized protein PAC_09379 [Phialocephala subalpina]|uniref:Hsp70 protein n=1 Tax=Phialocephala subalpina TaxID=576137 RepID=A0A1L7X3C5_9HELO|nr:uncharacterized protein PAC_09379 [Phialocephala subalpina]